MLFHSATLFYSNGSVKPEASWELWRNFYLETPLFLYPGSLVGNLNQILPTPDIVTKVTVSLVEFPLIFPMSD